MHPFQCRCLLKPFTNPYEDWKEKFVRIKGQDSASPVVAEEKGKPFFPKNWYSYPRFTTRVNPYILSPFDREVGEVLECFIPLDCNILINLDHEEDNGVEGYLGMEKYFPS